MSEAHLSSFEYDSATDICYRRLDFLAFPGYRVGDDGSVWSRRGVTGLGYGRGTASVVRGEWRRLATRPWGRAYLSVSVVNRRRLVHRLVLLAFVGPCPVGMECCHKDGARTHNHLANLRWDTPRANATDRANHGRDACGERNAAAVVTEAQVRAIRAKYATLRRGRHAVPPGALAGLAADFGIGVSAVGFIVRRETWKHVV